jgi:hypothetical protein
MEKPQLHRGIGEPSEQTAARGLKAQGNACPRIASGSRLPRQGNPMAAIHPIRKACPARGRPMKLAPDDPGRGGERYVCPYCDGDPLHDPATQKCIDSPLKPPSQS